MCYGSIESGSRVPTGVEQRGGAYERGGGSGSTRGNVMQRMFRRSTSQRESPVVKDYNLAADGRRGMTQPRIDTGSWTQMGKNAKEAIGKAWSKFFSYCRSTWKIG